MKSMKHILTLALALLVLALPLSALADDQGLSFSLSNITVKTEGLASNIDTTIDAGIELNVVTPEDMSYFDAVLNVLAGGEKALSAGVTYDQETAAVTMALAGATDALSMKMTDAVQQTPMAQLPVDTEAIAAAFASLNDLTLSEDAQNALSNAVMGWMVQHIPSEPTGSEDVEITDMMDDTAVATLTMDAYDFEMTVGDIVDLLTDAGDALKTDPAFIAGIQSFIDQIMAAVGQPSFDITQAGEQLPEDVLATTISGTVYTSESGTVIDLVIGDNLGCFIDVVNMEDGTLFVQNAIIAPDGTTANTRAILNGATMQLTVDQVVSAGTDEYTQATTWNVTADMSEGINLAFYVAQNMAYTGEDAYESNQAFYGGFEGDMVSDETATGLAGTLALGAEMGELVFDVTCDVTVLQSDSVDVSFDMPNNVIDISTADEETQAAIGEEYLGLLQNGFFKLMGAPGVADVINALNPGEQ